MVVRIAAFLSLLLVGTVAAQNNAEINLFIDDHGEVFLNGTFLTTDTTAFPATIGQGQNCMAILAINDAWGGGIYFSTAWENTNGTFDTLVSDGSWMCTNRQPTDDLWKEVGFDESAWYPAGDHGLCADDTGGDPTRHFLNNGIVMANIFYHGGHLIGSPRTCYIRHSFNQNGGTGTAFIRGNGFTYDLYVNGTMVGNQDYLNVMGDPADQYAGITLNNGENVIAARVTDAIVETIPDGPMRGDGVLCKIGIGAGSFRGSDNTWKVSFDEIAGWNDVGFADGGWTNVGTPTAYDGTTDALSAADWVWPQYMYLRREFETTIGVDLKINRIGHLLQTRGMKQASGVVTHQFGGHVDNQLVDQTCFQYRAAQGGARLQQHLIDLPLSKEGHQGRQINGLIGRRQIDHFGTALA